MTIPRPSPHPLLAATALPPGEKEEGGRRDQERVVVRYIQLSVRNAEDGMVRVGMVEEDVGVVGMEAVAKRVGAGVERRRSESVPPKMIQVVANPPAA
jgi:hypothetical protein